MGPRAWLAQYCVYLHCVNSHSVSMHDKEPTDVTSRMSVGIVHDNAFRTSAMQ